MAEAGAKNINGTGHTALSGGSSSFGMEGMIKLNTTFVSGGIKNNFDVTNSQFPVAGIMQDYF